MEQCNKLQRIKPAQLANAGQRVRNNAYNKRDQSCVTELQRKRLILGYTIKKGEMPAEN